MQTLDLEGLTRALSSFESPTHTLVVGIDGVDGSGKSTLALNILKQITGKVISIDDYVEEKKGEYLPRIDYEKLQNDIHQFKLENMPIIVIEGVCLLNVLENISIEPDKIVYVKRVARDGSWLNSRLCDPEFTLEELLRKIDRSENVPGIGNLDREILLYHRRYFPVEKADFIFERVYA